MRHVARLGLAPLLFWFLPTALCAFESGTYVPHYRLAFLPGAENALGRAVLDPAPDAWSGRLAADSQPRHLPSQWTYRNWGSLLSSSYDSWFYHIPLSLDEEGAIDRNAIDHRHLGYLDAIRRFYGGRLSLSILGFEDSYGSVAENEASREVFLRSLVQTAEGLGCDGIDIDWEFRRDANPGSIEAYTIFLRDLSALLSDDMNLSITASRWRDLPSEALDVVDEIRIMAYDGYGKHSTFESAVSDVETLIARYNLDRSSVSMGLPFYGRIWEGHREDYWFGTRSYRDIVTFSEPRTDEDTADGYYFNSPATIRRKTAWAKESGLGGVFVWEVFHDLRSSRSLSSAIAQVTEAEE